PRGRLVVVDVRDVQQLRRLLADRGDDARMGVPEVVDREAGEEIDVGLAVGVPEARALAAHERDGKARVHADLCPVGRVDDLSVRHESLAGASLPSVASRLLSNIPTGLARERALRGRALPRLLPDDFGADA